MTIRKSPSSFHVDGLQKEAMQIIRNEIGVSMTAQVKLGLDKFLQTYQETLKPHGFTFSDAGVLEKK